METFFFNRSMTQLVQSFGFHHSQISKATAYSILTWLVFSLDTNLPHIMGGLFTLVCHSVYLKQGLHDRVEDRLTYWGHRCEVCVGQYTYVSSGVPRGSSKFYGTKGTNHSFHHCTTHPGVIGPRGVVVGRGEGVVIANSKGVRFSLSLGHLEHYKRTYMLIRGCA